MPSPPDTLPRRRLLGLLALSPLARPAAAQTNFDAVEIRATKLTETLYMLAGAGGNVGVSTGPETVFLIDDQFAPLAPKIRAAIARLTPRPVQWVLNTHFHYDHTGGNEAFGRDGALIVAHDNVRRRMSTEQLIAFAGTAQTQAASPKAALPVVTVGGDVRFHVNGDELHAFHVPHAHTDGDLVVHFRRANAVHMGDTFFNGLYPFIDGGSGGTAEGVVAAHDRVLALADDATRIIPGHGPLAGRAELAAARAMLDTVLGRVKAMKAAGRSAAEIRAARPSAEFDARYGGGPMKPDLFVQQLVDVSGR